MLKTWGLDKNPAGREYKYSAFFKKKILDSIGQKPKNLVEKIYPIFI